MTDAIKSKWNRNYDNSKVTALVSRIEALTEDQLETALVASRNATKSNETLLRAMLFDEFESRHGEEMADALMDNLFPA